MHKEYFSQPIEESDIKEAIQSLPNNKAPGPDGLTAEFYKAYADLLAPCLLEMYAEAPESGILPPSLRQAMIII